MTHDDERSPARQGSQSQSRPGSRSDTARTIHVTYRNSRFARIRLRRPGPKPSFGARITAILPAVRIPDEPACYDADLAMELLGGTCELPETKRSLHIVIGEYRRALYDLATHQCVGR